MKVKILGTKFNDFSLMINDNILINLGENSINNLLKENYDLSKLDTIIITNLKQHSINSYPLLLSDLDNLGIRNKINIYLPKNGEEVLNTLIYNTYNTYFNSYIKEYINFIEIHDKKLINIKENTIKFIEVSNEESQNFGLIVDGKLGFTSESSICAGVKEIYMRSDFVITECSTLEGNSNHLGIDDIVVLSASYSGVKIFPVYLTKEILKELKDLSLNMVIIPTDNYTVLLN